MKEDEKMTIGRKSKKLVDQVFINGRGWIAIKPTPLRRLWWQDKADLMRHVESVHFVAHGDYRVTELR
jgi:hypothetical protein